MHTLTTEQIRSQPQSLLADAKRGEPALVVENGQPVFMTVPLGEGLEAREVRLELAVSLFDREQVSIGIAARIAGLSVSDMIDELGRRRIPVVRYGEDELQAEIAYVRTLAGRG
jgi:predicted HTH domain antitoxin